MSTTEIDPTLVPDELIIKQQNEIESEIKTSIPLVGFKEAFSTLLHEYVQDTVYTDKIHQLNKKYEFLRRMRPDGNCFFRACSFAILEELCGHPEEAKGFRAKVVESREKLKTAGFDQFTVDDFYEYFLEVVDKVISGLDAAGLEREFQEGDMIEYLIVYLRILTSAELKNNADFYGNFIEEKTVDEFCKNEVEPMYRESDHIHITALTAALQIKVRVMYMDRGTGESMAHDFPDSSNPTIHFLYRPGHYDVLYPRNPETT